MPIIYKKKFNSGLKLGVWKIIETNEQLFDKLVLSDAELIHVKKINHSKRYKHWLASRVLIKDLLQTDEFIQFEYDDYGKPNLVNVSGYISISHAADVAAIALSPDNHVGIDIERMQAKIERIAPKFMLKEEIASCTEENKIRDMYIHWCVREAVYKCYGKRQLDFRKHMLLQPINRNLSQQLEVKLVRSNIDYKYLVSIDEIGDYMLAYTQHK